MGLVERTVGTTPVIFIECFLDSRADSVVVNHIKIATQGVRELEFMVGREGGIILDLQTVSSHLRVCGFLVAAMTGSGTAKNTRVGICSWRKARLARYRVAKDELYSRLSIQMTTLSQSCL